MKSNRQNVILSIIAKQDIETQNHLLEALAQHGIQTTQATLSRDIKELRLVKELGPKGTYRYVANKNETDDYEHRLRTILRESVISYDVAQNIVVIKTVSGMAMAVAAALDHMMIPEIVGCIAGDDTIMCASKSDDDAKKAIEQITKLLTEL